MRRDEDRVGHIIDATARTADYLENTTWEAFYQNPMLQDAVLRQLLIVGEAATRHGLGVGGQWRRSFEKMAGEARGLKPR